MKKHAPVFIIVFIWICLISGFVRAAALPKQINQYELRPAQQLPPLSWEDYASGDYQSAFEASLTDQMPLSQYLKKAYNLSSSFYLKQIIDPIAKADEDLVVNYNGIRLYRGCMLYSLCDLEEGGPLFEELIESYNQAMDALPELRFCYYFIETDAVHDYIRDLSSPVYAYLRERLSVSEDQIGRLELRDFSDYCRCFLRTDHHWSAQGSYRAYLELLGLMKIEDDPLTPAEERSFPGYSGSKATSARLPAFTEQVQVFFFDYPDLGVSYGNEERFRSGEMTDFTYGEFYGTDEYEVVFDTGRPERENLLVLGDSYDNAILKLLASHFGKTYSVDLRYYPSGEEGFDLADYVQRNEIDRVLIIGSLFFFQDPTFAVRS